MDNSGNIKISQEDFEAQPSPQFQLVGNYFPDIIGHAFPPKPPLNFIDSNVVENCVCVATNGSGRIFLPVELITSLSNGDRVDEYVIMAAPGIPRCRSETLMFNAQTRTDMGDISIRYFQWYHKCLVDALKPIDDFIPKNGKFGEISIGHDFLIIPTWSDLHKITQMKIEADLILRRPLLAQTDMNPDDAALSTMEDVKDTTKYLQLFQREDFSTVKNIIFVLDDELQVDKLTNIEKAKLKDYCVPPSQSPSHTSTQLSHGTKIYQFLSATSKSNTEIIFMKVSGSSNKINFHLVREAFLYIINIASTDSAIWINCSFSLPSITAAKHLTDPDDLCDFFYFHNTIHRMGYIICAVAGNGGAPTPHLPWGQCLRCVIVGAYDHIKDQIASFSSGCCDPIVAAHVRGTNFSLLPNQPKICGASYSTSIMCGSFSFMSHRIWNIDEWAIFDEVVKRFIVAECEKKIGCGNNTNNHTPRQWRKFVLPALDDADGSSSAKVNLLFNTARSSG